MNFRSAFIPRLVRRSLAATLSAVLAAQPVLANLAEPGRAPALPTIRIIQDIHAHAEAQRSIAEALARIQKEAGRDLKVGVEGAAGPFDFAPYYAFPDDDIRRRVSSQLLDENLIAGPVYAALCRPVFRLVGIEDPGLYRDNVNAYLASRKSQERLLKTVAERQAALARRKAAAFDGALARFDRQVSSYRSGELPFGDYLEAISSAAGDTGLSVEQFLVAHRMERAIDFNRVEAERKTFVERLVRSLSDADVAQVRRWIEGLGEDSGAGRRFEFLFHAAAARGIDLSAFPALTDYVRYLRLSENVDADRLFSEAAAAEEAAYRRLCGSSTDAAALVSQARRLHLTEKLLRFEMTHEDWRSYEKMRPAGTELPEADLRPFEDFYRVAAERDTALANRARRGGLDAVVVGGFHTEGLVAAFRAAGIPFEIVRPRITSAVPGDATAYLSVFAAEKTPLERLFSRFRLFLAPPAVIGVPIPLVDSRNRNAPERFIAIYRRIVGDRAVLAAPLDAAAERLRASLHSEVASAAAGLNRPNFRWLTETGFLLLLAFGLAIGHDGVSAAGVAVQLIGLPLAHLFTVDRIAASPIRRFAARTVWSGAFLGVYGAALLLTAAIGMPLWLGATLALLPAAYAHWLNHVAARLPGSAAASVLFDALKLPVLRMSTDGGLDITPTEQPVIDEFSSRMRTAITAWQALPDKMAPTVEADPVTELLAQAERDLLGKEERYKVLALLGLATGLWTARLSTYELQARATRDFAAAAFRAVDLDARTEAYSLNSNVTTIIYRQAKVAYGGEYGGPVHEAIEAGRAAGLTESMRRLMRDAVADWRARRSAGDFATGDDRISWILQYAQLAADLGPPVFLSVSRGLAEGLLDSNLTQAELAARVRSDTARGGWVRAPGAKPRVQAGLYGVMVDAVKSKAELSDTIYANLTLGIRDAALAEFNGVIARWRASNEDVLARDPAEIFGFYTALMTPPAKSDPEELRARLESITAVAVAYGTAELSREEMIHVAYEDTLFSFSHWFNVGAPARDPLVDGINSMLDQLSAMGSTTQELVKIGREQGWYAATQRNAGESLRRLRKQAAAPVPLPSEFVPRLLPMLARLKFSVRATADSAAKGFLISEMTPAEALDVIADMLIPVLEGAPFRNDTNEFTVAGAIVNAIYDGSETVNDTMHQALGLSLDEYFNPAIALQRLLGELKASPGDEGLSRRIANVWIRVPNIRKRSADSATPDELVEAMFAADLPPDLLSRRAHGDVGVQIARFMQRPLADEEIYWPEKIQDPAIQATIDAYVRLARRYQTEGATERVAAIFEGLSLAANDPLTSGVGFNSTVYQLKYTLPLRDIAEAALEMNQPDTALAAARMMAGTAEISFELPEIVTWIYSILGRAYLERGEPDFAMQNGYEYAVASTYQDLSSRVVAPDEWASFMEMANQYALLFERQAGHGASWLIYRWILRFLEQHPSVAEKTNPDLVVRVRAMNAVTSIATIARPVYDVTQGKFDPARLAEFKRYLEEFDEYGLRVLQQTSISPLEKNVFLQAALDVNTEACFLGDAVRLDRVRELARMTYEGQPLLQKDADLRGRRNYAIGRPADRARVFQEIDEAYAAEPATTRPITSLDDLLFQESFAMYQAVKGNLVESERLLRAVDAAIQSPEIRAVLGDVAGDTPAPGAETEKRDETTRIVNKLRVLILSQLAGVMSGRNAPATEIAPVLREAFSLPGYDLRVTEDLNRFLEPGTFRTDVLLDAAGLVIAGPERDGAPLIARLSLLGWARAISPAGVAARRDAWTVKSRARDFRKAVADRLDQMNSVKPGDWPARLLLAVDHTQQMQIREEKYAEALDGLDRKVADNYKVFQRRLQTTRLFLHIYAATLAAAGLPKESLEVIRFGRQALFKGIRTFVPTAKLKLPEDIGVILFPTIAGDHVTTVNEAKQALTPDDANKVAVIGPYALAAAERVAEQEDFESPRDLKDALDGGIALVGKIRSAIPAASAEYTLARLRLYLGDFPAAIAALRKAVADTAPKAQSSVNRARPELASMTLRDPQRLLPARLAEATRLLDDTKASLDYSRSYVGYLEIVVSLFRYNPSDTAAAADLVRRVVELVDFAIENGEVKDALGYGLAFRAADVALTVGPRSGAEIFDALTKLQPLVGPRMGSVALAQRTITDLYERPAAFLAWMDAEHGTDHSADWTGLRLVAAERAKDETRAVAEAELLVDEHPVRYSDAYWVVFVTELLMESPTMRRAYLDTVMPLLTRFTPDRWSGKDRVETLRRLIEVAANLGDPEVIYVLDALAENKSFPLRENLARKDVGLLARLEPSLGIDEWIERISRMGDLNPKRVDALQAAAERRMTGPGDLERLRRLLDEKRTGFEARKAAAGLVYEARQDYRALEIERALAKLDTIEARFRDADWTALNAQLQRILAVWNVYQRGDFEGARDALTAFPAGDPAPALLRNRIIRMMQVRRELEEHRPQAAEVTLAAINGTLPDRQKAGFEAQVQAAYALANASFDRMKTASNKLPRYRAATEEVREHLRDALAVDSEFESVMRYVVTKAQTMIDLGNLALAEELLRMLAEESRLFDESAPGYDRFGEIRREFERFRALARARYMKEWLGLQLRVLRAEYEAREHLAARSGDQTGAGVEQQIFHLGEWEITDGGQFIVRTLSREVADTAPAAKKVRAAAPTPTLEPVALASTGFFQSAASFQVAFTLAPDNRVMGGVTFLRRDRDNQLVFSADPSSVELLRQMQRSGRKNGTMRFVKNISLFAQVTAMQETLSYLDRQIGALEEGRLVSRELPVVNRLLGLDISDQPSGPVESTVPVSPRFADDPSQLAAITAVVNPRSELTAIQGPPGTGKTSTGVEIARILTTGSRTRPGRILVITSQAHAGVDNIALRLVAAGIPTIRSASQSAQENVTRDLQTEEIETAKKKSRLDQLMAAIEAHQSQGAGFAYLVTNNGLQGDKKAYALLTMYLAGAPMSEIRARHQFYTKRQSGRPPRQQDQEEDTRKPIRPVWGQEEAGQANAAETLAIVWALRPDKGFLFGDQFQLAPHPIDESVQSLVEQEVKEGLVLSVGPLNRVFTSAAAAAMEVSPFELSYDYAAQWSRSKKAGDGGILLRFLSLARRSVWVITVAIVNYFYGERLRHRDQSNEESDWEELRKDTVVFVNSTGREVRSQEREDTAEKGRAIDQSPIVRSNSRVNFTEVGEVVRAATYHLNGRSLGADRRRREAGDILILTPYRGQNALINDVLRIVATLNDFARGDDVSADELANVGRTLALHAEFARFRGATEMNRMFGRLGSGNRRANVRALLEHIRPMYDVVFDGDVQISRADLPEIKVDTPPDPAAEESERPQESLDEQNANVIEAKTVHSVQGQERKVVIVSLVRSDNLGFLDDRSGQSTGRRIINVALSRVEDQLVVIYSNGLHPDSIGQMIPRLRENFAKQDIRFEPLRRFPANRAELASLRRAWNVSLGSDALDSFVDRRVMPVIETGAFLALLGVGLMHGDAMLALFGLLMKGVLFPVLHLVPGWLGLNPDAAKAGEAAALFRLSGVLTAIYVSSYFLLSLTLLSPVPAFFLAMIPVVLRHMLNNAEASRQLETRPAASLELDTVSGLSAERAARIAAELVPPVRRSPDPRIPDVRAVNSGA